MAEKLSAFWRGKRVAVPGGAGFVGAYVVDQLVALGADVIVIDDLSRGMLSRLTDVLDAVEWVEADIAEPGVAQSTFQGCDVVMNLAGVAPGLAPEQDWHVYLEEENLRIGRAVQSAALAARVPRLLVVSSSCVYPDDAPVPTPEMSLEASEPEQGNRGYGMAKRQLEAEAIAAARSQAQTRITIARPFNVYGAHDLFAGKGGHVIPSLLERILSLDTEVVVWGSGQQTRSFIHGRDLARALIRLTEQHALPEPVNIGSEQEIAMADLVRQLMSLSGVQKSINFDSSKPEGALRKAADTSRLLEILPDYEQEVDFTDGLREVVDAFIASRRSSNISTGN